MVTFLSNKAKLPSIHILVVYSMLLTTLKHPTLSQSIFFYLNLTIIKHTLYLFPLINNNNNINNHNYTTIKHICLNLKKLNSRSKAYKIPDKHLILSIYDAETRLIFCVAILNNLNSKSMLCFSQIFHLELHK